MTNMVILFQNQIVTGNGLPILVPIVDADLELQVFGTFGGTSFSLQELMIDGVTWVTINDATGTPLAITTNNRIIVQLPYNATVRGVLTGGTGISLTAALVRLGHKRN